MKISAHEVAVAVALLEADCWVAAKDVARQAEVSERSACRHLATLTAAGIAERLRSFPAYLYRWRHARHTNAYAKALFKTMEVLREAA